ncbi:hypothetical protein Q3G72_028747 [Acer saccharum]|nr:hypothetical protein Q3G72_028747 [Acer saccharum]
MKTCESHTGIPPWERSRGTEEAMAMLRGLNFALKSGLLPCTLEFDAKEFVDLINAIKIPYFDVGLIMGDICNFYSMVAHSPTKLGLTYDCDSF